MPEPGTRIDVFELEESIGVGGMGAVFRARDTRLEREVALKILPPEQAGDPEVVQRFYQEGRAAARLDHENIARVYTIGHDDVHFIAFEYIEGTTIRQRVELGGPLPSTEAVNYTLQIANALVHASERGVVHRDIKPSNIIVTAQGRAKLVDMGLARRFERGRDDGLTQSGMTLGTFDYISPEQARDPRDVDVRSDLYSLGCTLFHMLAGRPPFPDGTVLQKLIQHQEEAPPRIRDLNPAVPTDLAAILAKLMAKDRERRYQTPEALLRDLSGVAGALGLRSLSPEGLIWAAPTPPPAWERHLIWGVPAFVFLTVLGFVAWWNFDSSTNQTMIAGKDSKTPAITIVDNPTDLDFVDAPAEPTMTVTKTETEIVPVESEPRKVSLDSRQILVHAGDDLSAIVASAPLGTEIILADDDRPYLVGGVMPRAPLARRDLVIRAAAGLQPTIRLTREAALIDAIGSPAIFDFLGGRVTLEEIEFVVDGSRGDSIHASDTELTIRRCVFRREGTMGSSRVKGAAIHLRTGSRALERPPALTIAESHIGGNQAGILAVGPVDLTLRDCTIGGAEPVVWLDNAEGSNVLADLRLSHVSLLGGFISPAFQFQGSHVHVRADDSVFAGGREAFGTLVSIDDPEKLDWRGRANLFARVSTYLRTVKGRASTIRDFNGWHGGRDELREVDSASIDQNPWRSVDPLTDLNELGRNPTLAFEIGPLVNQLPSAGARRGPISTLERAPIVAERPTVETEPDGKEPVPAEAAVIAATPPMPLPMNRVPMGDGPGEAPAIIPGPLVASKPSEIAKPNIITTPTPTDNLIRTAGQLAEAMAKSSNRGVLRIAADADIEIGTTLIVKADGLWTLRAEPGVSRPRIKFKPERDPKANLTSSVWPIGIRVASNLRLEGIDLLLKQADAPTDGSWAPFGVWAGAELSLVRCTITLERDGKSTALATIPTGGIELEPGIVAPEPSAAAIRITDSFIRLNGDLVDVTPGRRFELEVENSVLALSGAVIHGHGLPRGLSADPLRLALRQTTARAQGGLVYLQSAVGEPELPVVEVTARDSIVGTKTDDDPLFRVEGQENLDSLRDRIKWEGHGVAYDQIEYYRRDQTSQPGSMPSNYRRPAWEVTVGLKDTSPLYGPFLNPWPNETPASAMQIDDVRLPAESPATSVGPDLNRVPNAPGL